MTKKSFALVLMLALVWPCAHAAPPSPSSAAIEKIRVELEHIGAADQTARRNFNHLNPEHVENMHVVDASNRRKLKEIMRVIGWPTTELVGEKAATGAFLVAQHAGDDLDFMMDVFAFIEAGYKRARVSPSHYALMYDRIKMLEGKPQRYGTQFNKNATGCHAWKMEDPGKVVEYRAGMGLGSLADYAKKVCGGRALPSMTIRTSSPAANRQPLPPRCRPKVNAAVIAAPTDSHSSQLSTACKMSSRSTPNSTPIKSAEP